jgi:tetratricopeptide (TPR) repeat protein
LKKIVLPYRLGRIPWFFILYIILPEKNRRLIVRLLKNPKPATFFLLVIVIYIFSGVLSGFEYRKITSIKKDLIRKYQAADKYFKRAKSKFHKGNYTKAEKDLTKCINIFHKHANGEYSLALICYKKSDYKHLLNIQRIAVRRVDKCVNRLSQERYFYESMNAEDIETKCSKLKEKN